jgi:hypothetical protein
MTGVSESEEVGGLPDYHPMHMPALWRSNLWSEAPRISNPLYPSEHCAPTVPLGVLILEPNEGPAEAWPGVPAVGCPVLDVPSDRI